MSVATSIAPNDLLDADPEIFWAMLHVLDEQNKEMERNQRRR